MPHFPRENYQNLRIFPHFIVHDTVKCKAFSLQWGRILSYERYLSIKWGEFSEPLSEISER
jgi:hypothetical protein